MLLNCHVRFGAPDKAAPGVLRRGRTSGVRFIIFFICSPAPRQYPVDGHIIPECLTRSDRTVPRAWPPAARFAPVRTFGAAAVSEPVPRHGGNVRDVICFIFPLPGTGRGDVGEGRFSLYPLTSPPPFRPPGGGIFSPLAIVISCFLQFSDCFCAASLLKKDLEPISST